LSRPVPGSAVDEPLHCVFALVAAAHPAVGDAPATLVGIATGRDDLEVPVRVVQEAQPGGLVPLPDRRRVAEELALEGAADDDGQLGVDLAVPYPEAGRVPKDGRALLPVVEADTNGGPALDGGDQPDEVAGDRVAVAVMVIGEGPGHGGPRRRGAGRTEG